MTYRFFSRKSDSKREKQRSERKEQKKDKMTIPFVCRMCVAYVMKPIE